MMRAPKVSITISAVSSFFFGMSWHLREEIMILRLMLYRVECLPPDFICLHNDNLMSKIGELEKELALYEDQMSA